MSLLWQSEHRWKHLPVQSGARIADVLHQQTLFNLTLPGPWPSHLIGFKVLLPWVYLDTRHYNIVMVG